MSNATLENTYWKLVELGGEPARVAENIAEPHLLLHPAKKQADGSTGCNRFSGSYELRGDSLRLGPLAATRRACLDPEMNRQESTLLEAFSATRSWKATGDTLVLSNDITVGEHLLPMPTPRHDRAIYLHRDTAPRQAHGLEQFADGRGAFEAVR